MTDDQWRSRPMQVTVRELCPVCEKLSETVKMHPIYSFPPKTLFACLDCVTAKTRETTWVYGIC